MKRLCLLAAVVFVGACGSEFHAPFENANPAAPTIQVGADGRAHSSGNGVAPAGIPNVPPAGMRNEGTKVWIIPVPGGDMMRLATDSELWVKAQRRVDVVGIFFLEAYDEPGFVCGEPCGPNTYQALVNAVPGGMFKWLSDRFLVSMETGSIKPQACTPERVADIARITNIAIANIKKAGGRLDYIVLDEPFASGTAPDAFDPFYGRQAGCGLTSEQVAARQHIFNDDVHAQHPEVEIGLIEPYPLESADVIMANIQELENAGITLPFFRVDYDQVRAMRENRDWKGDLRRLRDFCRAKRIPFGVILWGADGSSNEAYAAGHRATARSVLQAVGVTEDTVLESWAEVRPNQGGVKSKPDTVPETDPNTHFGLLNWTLDFFNIKPR